MSKHHYFYEEGLQSNRLTTRFLTSDDVEQWSDFLADEQAIQFLPNFAMASPREWAEVWISKQIERYQQNRFGLQALIDKETNKLIGQCGLLLQEVDGIPEIEVGYHIFPQYWGKAYAPEAAKLFIDFAFNHELTDSVISIIETRNMKSQRVADKNGLLREKATQYMNLDVFIYRINRQEH